MDSPDDLTEELSQRIREFISTRTEDFSEAEAMQIQADACDNCREEALERLQELDGEGE